jgi:FkbM family methyltransferase
MQLEEPMRLKLCRYGPMVYLSTDQYIGQALDKYGEFSEGEVHLFRHIVKEGWTVLDVGANHGTHTIALSKLVGPSGKVHSFEPQRILFQIACANVALNTRPNVYLHNVAVGSEPKTLYVPPVDYSQANNFGALELGQVGEPVPVITLNSLDLDTCHFIKADAEGMEGEIVAGASRLIERCQPIWYVENDRDDKSPQLIQQFWDLGYVLFYHLPYYFNRYNFSGQGENIYGGTISVNMLCVPKTKVHTSIPQDCFYITKTSDTWRTVYEQAAK